MAVDDGAGKLAINTAGRDGDTDLADVTGSEVPVVVVTFKVRANAALGSNDEAIALYVADMVNTYSIKFGSAITGQMNDERGGGRELGQLTVVPILYAGIFACK